MENTTPTEQTEKPEQFTIQSREHGEWYLRKLANIEAERQRIEAQAALMLRQLETDRNGLTGRYQSQFENLVRIELEASKGKRKSVTFFNGTAGFRTVASRLVIESEADALTTARLVAPATITTEAVERFDKAAFRAHAAEHFETTGEILPGFTRTEERQEFSVKFPTSKEKGDTTEAP
ncbi:host-nuclease inhibitor Gam family protein [Armatimonas sp.]|uniref:host-nuclease inhibitor Gam family protein n=1 Tax=Armatimonas sp. TaxID=1872638 RepID=UPI00374CDEA3